MYITQPAQTSSVYNAAFVLDVDIPMGRDLDGLGINLKMTATVSGSPTATVANMLDKLELIANGSDYLYTWQGADVVAFMLEAAMVAPRNETIATGTAKYLRGELFAQVAKKDIASSLKLRATFLAPNAVDSNISAMATELEVSYRQRTVRRSIRQEYFGMGGSKTTNDEPLPQKKGVAVWLMIASATEYITKLQLTDHNKTYRLDASWGAIRTIAQRIFNVTDAAGLYTAIPLDPLACTKDTVLRTTQSTAQAMRVYTRHVCGVYRNVGAPDKLKVSAGEWERPYKTITEEADQLAFVASPVE